MPLQVDKPIFLLTRETGDIVRAQVEIMRGAEEASDARLDDSRIGQIVHVVGDFFAVGDAVEIDVGRDKDAPDIGPIQVLLAAMDEEGSGDEAARRPYFVLFDAVVGPRELRARGIGEVARRGKAADVVERTSDQKFPPGLLSCSLAAPAALMLWPPAAVDRMTTFAGSSRVDETALSADAVR
jgi:hypothetical protein